LLSPRVLLSVPVLGISWASMWTMESYWSPLFFVGTWFSATLIVYSLGPGGYPGWRTHLWLSLLSIPLWWWFELVNTRVGNWEYLRPVEYDALEYAVFASLAFSTVIPAMNSAWRVFLGFDKATLSSARDRGRSLHVVELVAGLASISLVFLSPDLLFPLVWVGPFLVLDGVVGLQRGGSLLRDIAGENLRRAPLIAGAGLSCGFLWEFWNYWASPKWVYDIPYLEMLHAFEMPLAGYLGYIPFIWAVYQLVRVRPIVGVVSRLERGGAEPTLHVYRP
jgi:hypothetical protein